MSHSNVNSARSYQGFLAEINPLLTPSDDTSAVVAMSGGVDSSVAAYLMAAEGWQAVGVSMQVWDYKGNEGNTTKATCCSPGDFCDARRVAASSNIPYYVVDFEESFRREVIDKFVETYEKGETPNPCIDCNSKVKFRELRMRAATFGCTHVVTGHYARIERSGETLRLLRGKDIDKDQSYFLYTCKREELNRTLFPIGHFTKAEVREIARDAGLATADKAESQDICFVAGSVFDFVSKIGKRRPVGGDVVTADGRKVGQHDGITRYTVGQRRGLRIGGTEDPLYVVEIDAEANRVIVGGRAELRRETFRVSEMNWLRTDLGGGTFPFELECLVQVRSRHRGIRAKVTVHEANEATVNWIEEWSAVSPGQAAVFYSLDNEEVYGGGRIQKEHRLP